MLDTRYMNLGVASTVKQIQDRSGVSEILNVLPRFEAYAEKRAEKKIDLWTKSTTPWSLECESIRLSR